MQCTGATRTVDGKADLSLSDARVGSDFIAPELSLHMMGSLDWVSSCELCSVKSSLSLSSASSFYLLCDNMFVLLDLPTANDKR